MNGLKKYNATGPKSWVQILVYNSDNETDALDLFFKLWDEYRSIGSSLQT